MDSKSVMDEINQNSVNFMPVSAKAPDVISQTRPKTPPSPAMAAFKRKKYAGIILAVAFLLLIAVANVLVICLAVHTFSPSDSEGGNDNDGSHHGGHASGCDMMYQSFVDLCALPR